MGERSKERGLPPQLLILIPDEREWKVEEAGGGSRGISFGAEEDNKLELKLGLPGVQQDQGAAGSREQKIHQQLQAESCSELSLGCFPAHSKLPNTGAKRGFFDTVVAKPEGCSLQDTEGCGNEWVELRLGGENMSGERKKGCCPPPSSSHGSAAAAAPVHNSSSSSSSPQGRAAVLPAVGWPPVRSFRRNLAHGSSSKQSPERQNNEDDGKAKLI